MEKTARAPMARRLCTAASGVLLSAASSFASALGLGEISADSFLGQPFYGRVELVNAGSGINADNLTVRSVAPSEASAMGSDVFYGPHQLDVKLVESGGELFIEMSTGTPVKEPYLSILLELRWPSGVLYREYPVLLDPPPAISVPSQQRSQPTAVDRYSPVNATSRPASRVSSRAIDLQPLQTDEGRYRVERGDNLSTISARWVEGTSQTIGEANRWLLENNPQAFVNGDMDRLIAGATLLMPDLSALRTQTDEQAAEPETANVAPSPEGAGDGVAVAAEDSADESTAPEQARTSADSASAEDVRGLMTVSDNTDDRTRELIDMLTRENQNLRSRMQKVESSEYVTTMRELIQLQQKQIQELQDRLGEEEVPSTEMQSMYESVDMAPVMPGATGEQQVDESEALSRQEILRESANNLDNIEVEQTNDQAIVEVEPQGVETLVDDRDEQRSRLITLLFIAGGILTAIFAAMLLYYRKTTGGSVESDEDLPPLDSLRSEPRVQPLTEKKAPKNAPEQDATDPDATDPGIDPDDDFALTANAIDERPDRPSQPWYGETANLDDDINLDGEFNDLLQDEFSNLELDDEFLNDARFDVADASLEGFTNELQQGDPAKADDLPIEDAKSDAKANIEGGQRKDKVRRSDEEVRSSIAEKMSQYQNGERSSEDVMKTLELEEFEHLDEQGSYDEIESVVYRALMYCEFKKFEKARHLIELKMETEDDPRLTETLEQVEALEMESQKKNAI